MPAPHTMILRKKFWFMFVCLWAVQAFAQTTPVCDPRAYGAKGDGVNLDTVAVTAAINACANQGGGTVYFPPGRYLIGTVQLQSHIHLQLENGASLAGSTNIKDYLPSPPFGFARHYGVDITGEGSLLGMLIAKNAEDISIEGGEIDGQGDNFMQLQVPHTSPDYEAQYVRNPEKFRAAMNTLEYGPIEPHDRPGTLIVFFHCKNVRVHGITLRNAPNWTLHLQDVQHAAISNIQILNNPKVPNNDGIDCMQCHHVQISNCDIETGDDGFAIVGSEYINITNCSIASRSAAIRLESTKLSTFTGLSMDTNRGIAIFASANTGDEAPPTGDVTFSDIVMLTHLIPGGWWGKAEPIYIAVQPCAPNFPCDVKIRNVTFNNITAESEGGSLLWGGQGSPITGIELNGIHIHMHSPDPAISDSVGGNLDLRWTAATPRDGVVKSDIPAFYAKKVTNLRLRDVQVDWPTIVANYFSESLRVEDFDEVIIDSFSGRQAQTSKGAAIYLKNGAGVSITNSGALPGTTTFLQLEKVKNRRVFVNYDVKSAERVISPVDQRFNVQIGIPAAARKPTN